MCQSEHNSESFLFKTQTVDGMVEIANADQKIDALEKEI